MVLFVRWIEWMNVRMNGLATWAVSIIRECRKERRSIGWILWS